MNKPREREREVKQRLVKVTTWFGGCKGGMRSWRGGAGLPEVLVTVFPDKGQQGTHTGGQGLEGKVEKLPRF